MLNAFLLHVSRYIYRHVLALVRSQLVNFCKAISHLISTLNMTENILWLEPTSTVTFSALSLINLESYLIH